MAPSLKPLGQQVIVITGATSGIGLATAREAANRGASLVLAARSARALEAVVSDLAARGARAIGVEADVADEADVRRIGDAAIDAFGRIDSWVSNAGLSLYGRFRDVPIEDQRRLFDVNYWGVVYGAREALRRIKGPGAIISLGSVLSDVPMPLQSAYAASKHAVKGFIDSLRIEVDREGRPISLTVIKPAAIDTPFADHARSHDKRAPALPKPVYAPELVAEAILHACETPLRETYVGGAAAGMATMWRTMPAAFDWYAKTFLYSQQRQRPSARTRALRDNLCAHRQGEARGVSGAARAKETSLYTSMALHPERGWAIAAAALIGLGLAFVTARAGGSALTSAKAGLKQRVRQRSRGLPTSPKVVQSEPATLAGVH